MPEKDEEIEQVIPVEWRSFISDVVDDIRMRELGPKTFSDFELIVDKSEIDQIYLSIDSYGETLSELPNESWDSSICRWMGDSWSLLIDLFTVEEGLSDLVLFIDVTEDIRNICFKVRSVHVP